MEECNTSPVLHGDSVEPDISLLDESTEKETEAADSPGGGGRLSAAIASGSGIFGNFGTVVRSIYTSTDTPPPLSFHT